MYDEDDDDDDGVACGGLACAIFLTISILLFRYFHTSFFPSSPPKKLGIDLRLPCFLLGIFKDGMQHLGSALQRQEWHTLPSVRWSGLLVSRDTALLQNLHCKFFKIL